MGHAADQQRRPGNEHHCKEHFRHDQGPLHPGSAPGAARFAAFPGERAVDLTTEERPDWEHRDGCSHRDREAERRSQGRPVQSERVTETVLEGQHRDEDVEQ